MLCWRSKKHYGHDAVTQHLYYHLNPTLKRSAGAPEDLMAMFRYYRTQTAYHDLRKLEGAIFHGPSLKQWAVEHRDALIAALNK